MKVLLIEDNLNFINCLKREISSQLPEIKLNIAVSLDEAAQADLADFHTVLLDYWGPGARSYHDVVDIEQYAEKIISISTVESKNQLARNRGVSEVCQKIAGRDQESAERVTDALRGRYGQ